jgi:hypothetical protein
MNLAADIMSVLPSLRTIKKWPKSAFLGVILANESFGASTISYRNRMKEDIIMRTLRLERLRRKVNSGMRESIGNEYIQ